jgi:hypothetical protein
MSLVSAYPCLFPEARLVKMRTAGSLWRPRSLGALLVRLDMRATVLRPTYYYHASIAAKPRGGSDDGHARGYHSWLGARRENWRFRRIHEVMGVHFVAGV